MPIVVTVQVTNSTAVIAAGYDVIKVYRSLYQSGAFLEVSITATRPVLDGDVTHYDFEDTTGTSSSWYKTSYYNSGSEAESSLSTAVRGIEVEQGHVNSTYPAETSLTSSDSFDIDRIRYYIGDSKIVKRDYISPTCTNSYQAVSDDGYTVQLENRGYPLIVIKDSVEYMDSSNPIVIDYNFLTFSGTTAISTASGVVDIFYESFRHSDREILKAFNTTSAPPYVSSAALTDEMVRISSAVTIIRAEIARLMGESSGKFNLQGELSHDPEGLLKQKRLLLEELKGKLSELVEEVVSNSIEGVRVE